MASEYVRSLSIHPPSLSRAVMFLSGGNQQKVVLARWLCSRAKILIFDEPTRGIDVGAKAEVFALMNQLTGNKAAIVMISSEMPEILAMADRILVMRGGRFTAEFALGRQRRKSFFEQQVEEGDTMIPTSDKEATHHHRDLPSGQAAR